jgi:hypothetical protein
MSRTMVSMGTHLRPAGETVGDHAGVRRGAQRWQQAASAIAVAIAACSASSPKVPAIPQQPASIIENACPGISFSTRRMALVAPTAFW